jgi:hypothetical protein
MNSYVNQYKSAFYLSWILLYLIYPSWALPVDTVVRFFVFSGFLLCFTLSKYFVGRLLNNLNINEPFLYKPPNIVSKLKDDKWLFFVCLVATIPHIYLLTSPIFQLGDEALHLQGGLWVYDYLGRVWHKSLRIIFWILLVGFFIGILRRDLVELFLKNIKRMPEKFLVFVFLGSIFLYFIFFRNIAYDLLLIRYPPTSKILYLFSYLIFGITHIGPRLIQLSFYLLSAFYLYRTINLYLNKKASLVGASFYLFAPLPFYFAHTAEIASGVAFFIIIISFYFLRYLKYTRNKDLILTSFLIGVGFLYKRDIFLMFFICGFYLLLYKLFTREKIFKKESMVLFISLIPIIPWMIIGKFLNWRNYHIHWSHFVSLDIVTMYLKLLKIEVSILILIVFLISLIFILFFKRNNLSYFYGFLFFVFYFFYTADYTAPYRVHRFSLAFYPAIAVFLAQMIYSFNEKIKWRHFFTSSIIIICTYLILFNASSPFKNESLGNRTLKFPTKEAMLWVKKNVKEGEKILTLRIFSARFYIDKFNIEKDRTVVLWYELTEVEDKEKLRNFCLKEKITYIMFPYSPEYSYSSHDAEILEYIYKNRNKKFKEAAKFNINKNYIYIYKLLKKKFYE